VISSVSQNFNYNALWVYSGLKAGYVKEQCQCWAWHELCGAVEDWRCNGQFWRNKLFAINHQL